MWVTDPIRHLIFSCVYFYAIFQFNLILSQNSQLYKFMSDCNFSALRPKQKQLQISFCALQITVGCMRTLLLKSRGFKKLESQISCRSHTCVTNADCSKLLFTVLSSLYLPFFTNQQNTPRKERVVTKAHELSYRNQKDLKNSSCLLTVLLDTEQL